MPRLDIPAEAIPRMPGKDLLCRPFSPAHFFLVGTESVREMLHEVRLRFSLNEGRTEVKPGDATLVGICDRESGLRGRSYLQARIQGASFKVEDVGTSQPVDGAPSILILADPLDGTRPWANGAPTSSVIVAAYDLIQKRVVACVIGDMACGRIWRSIDGQAQVELADGTFESAKVWHGELGPQSTVFLDAAKDFKVTGGRVVLSNRETGELMQGLFEKSQLSMLGSNGLHQALVASGGNFGRERVAGGITTAIGGPWDVAGAHLVLNSGGAVRAFSAIEPGKLIERDALDPLSFDVLVYGNSAATVESLSEILARASSRKIGE